MSTIRSAIYDYYDYNPDDDTLVLSRGMPDGMLGRETDSGHFLLYNADTDQSCGVLIVGTKKLLKNSLDDSIVISLQTEDGGEEEIILSLGSLMPIVYGDRYQGHI